MCYFNCYEFKFEKVVSQYAGFFRWTNLFIKHITPTKDYSTKRQFFKNFFSLRCLTYMFVQ